MNAIIVDDEESGRKVLSTLLTKYCPEVLIAGEAKNVKEAVSLVLKAKPDLIFLDIEMPGGSGFDLLGKTDALDFAVIFTTAYDHYALKAIKFSAMDYLLKPISIEELITAVNKVKTAKENAEAKIRLRNFLINNKAISPANKIALHTKDGLQLIAIKDFIRFEADGKYTWCYLSNTKKILSSKNLKEFEDLLSDYNFIRIHHSHLVNIEHIQYYIKGEGGIVVMSNEDRVNVSKRQKEAFLDRINKI